MGYLIREEETLWKLGELTFTEGKYGRMSQEVTTCVEGEERHAENRFGIVEKERTFTPRKEKAEPPTLFPPKYSHSRGNSPEATAGVNKAQFPLRTF